MSDMVNWQEGIWAAVIGGAGSLAYFTALYFGFIQSEVLASLWPASGSARRSTGVQRVLWFAVIGAAVALIFQLPEGNVAPIQAFIVGTTWPTVVAQILTSRQADSPDTIRAQISQLLGDE